jgi:hypothetical protein
MNLTPHATAEHWAADYVGRVWSQSFNCWHLVQEVQANVFHRSMHDLPIGTPESQLAALQRITKDWRQVSGAMREGDLLTMVCDLGPHVGVMIDGERVLHNVGGVDEKKGVWGSVRVDAVRDLGRLQYGHFKLWRAL